MYFGRLEHGVRRLRVDVGANSSVVYVGCSFDVKSKNQAVLPLANQVPDVVVANVFGSSIFQVSKLLAS